MVNWPDPELPPINLFNAPAKETSPCIGVCKIENDECVGCGRTMDEIANWSTMSPGERSCVIWRTQYQTKPRS